MHFIESLYLQVFTSVTTYEVAIKYRCNCAEHLEEKKTLILSLYRRVHLVELIIYKINAQESTSLS